MAKVQSDIGAIATMLSKFAEIFNFRQKTKELRYLKEACKQAQLIHKRAWKLSKQVREDKACNKYRRKFDKWVI